MIRNLATKHWNITNKILWKSYAILLYGFHAPKKASFLTLLDEVLWAESLLKEIPNTFPSTTHDVSVYVPVWNRENGKQGSCDEVISKLVFSFWSVQSEVRWEALLILSPPGNGSCGQFTTHCLCWCFFHREGLLTFSVTVWGHSHGRKSCMNFSRVGPSHSLQRGPLPWNAVLQKQVTPVWAPPKDTSPVGRLL